MSVRATPVKAQRQIQFEIGVEKRMEILSERKLCVGVIAWLFLRERFSPLELANTVPRLREIWMRDRTEVSFSRKKRADSHPVSVGGQCDQRR
jgi:hypothetical protein